MDSKEAPDPRPAAEAGDEEAGSADAGSSQAALVKLHAALKDLDRALFEARRALDVALDRTPDVDPPTDLPYRELRRLAEELQRAAKPDSEPVRPRIQELLDAAEDEDSSDAPARRPVAGVAPSGKLRTE